MVCSWCEHENVLATKRARGSSLYSSSPKPIEQVVTASVANSFINATTQLESTPPLRKAPSGTSLNRCDLTDCLRSARSCCSYSSSLASDNCPSCKSQYLRWKIPRLSTRK